MSRDSPEDTVHLSTAQRQREIELPSHVRHKGVRGACPFRSLRVLIVDDEQEVADALSASVTAWGHHARRAYDGASGLVVATDHLPNVVLLDIAMPEMDGYELAEGLRCHAGLGGCFLVAMRASGDERSSSRRKQANIDLFLKKPIEIAILETLLLMEGERLDRLKSNPSSR